MWVMTRAEAHGYPRLSLRDKTEETPRNPCKVQARGPRSERKPKPEIRRPSAPVSQAAKNDFRGSAGLRWVADQRVFVRV